MGVGRTGVATRLALLGQVQGLTRDVHGGEPRSSAGPFPSALITEDSDAL
jgi:hypothetical protein